MAHVEDTFSTPLTTHPSRSRSRSLTRTAINLQSLLSLSNDDMPDSDNQRDETAGNTTAAAALAAVNGGPPTAPVESVHSCKLPPFWKASPEAWFMQVEAAFASNQVRNDNMKYNLALAKLDGDTVQEMLDVLRVVPVTEKYKYRKDSVIKGFADSQDQRLQKLLSAASTEGRKPSQVLRHMRTLAGNLTTDEILKIKWLNVLPA